MCIFIYIYIYIYIYLYSSLLSKPFNCLSMVRVWQYDIQTDIYSQIGNITKKWGNPAKELRIGSFSNVPVCACAHIYGLPTKDAKAPLRMGS